LKQKQSTDFEPLWRDEFSIHAAHESMVTRRQFTKFLTLTSLSMLVGNLWILVMSSMRKPELFQPKVIAKVDEIPLGGVKLFRYPTDRDPCILVHTEDNQFAAYSQKCTHLSCPVYYSAVTKQLECPCHEGTFSLSTGEVIKGPPPRALPKVIVEEQNGVLVAVGFGGRQHD
jgi:Rieske Fe-S protein